MKVSHVPLLATPWTAAYKAPPSMGFARQEYWSVLPLPSPFEATCLFYCPWCFYVVESGIARDAK